jgi:hypothetical protein
MMRARTPDHDGYVEREGVKVFYEVFGHGEPTILLMPAWSVVHSRCWKMQVPFLARHYRVITFDGRGNGCSGRPAGADSYLSAEYAADALAVMDATVHDLYRHLAVCDLAVVQGGLTTTMELVASNRPFPYFPLGHQFEQTFHVPHRLARYRAGRRMEYATATPEFIGAAIAAEIGKQVAYRQVSPQAVGRVARLIAEML